MEGLKSRDEITDNITTKILKAYHVTLDVECFRYINTNKEMYDGGEDITPKKLMMEAINKFRYYSPQENEI